MLKYLPGFVKGVLVIVILATQTLMWVPFIIVAAFFKYLLPFSVTRHFCNSILNKIVICWMGINNGVFRAFYRTEWEIRGVGKLDVREWYLLLPNHQSGADIFALQMAFCKKIPPLKFFLKRELIWVPVFGFIWKVLDFPFMKRYSRETLLKKPHLKGKDLEKTRKACEKFRGLPVAIINFVEGTRFRPEKQRKQQSPYRHLLKPKAGGIAFVLGAMGGQLHRILDITLVYPDGVVSLWQFFCGKARKIVIQVRDLPVASELIGDYFNDMKFKEGFQRWLNELWALKDKEIEKILLAESGQGMGSE
ncbi:MAG: acyltransferase [Acidobacteria bacterium]|nr:acyltransferase [Acidobacteriota bacterium]